MAAEQSARQSGSLRLGGARADFVAGLGRKVADLRAVLRKVSESPLGLEPREEFRKKLRALAAAAKMMKFDAMDRAIAEALGTIDRTPADAAFETIDLESLEQVLEDLPALAWGDDHGRVSRIAPIAPPAKPTYEALVVGSHLISEALLDAPVPGGPTFGCESTPDAQAAFDLARELEPDVLILDADLDDVPELVDALMDDPKTEATKIVVIGSFLEQGEAARFVAMGVAKTLQKPTSREALRALCEEVLRPLPPMPSRSALGEPTLAELGERLAVELREALVFSADSAHRVRKIPLGEGAEVLGALWGAIARVREVVTAKTDGDVRFTGTGPEGAMPLAPLGDFDPGAGDRSRVRARGAQADDVRLEGRQIVVADDDPAVVWFMADLLKQAGCVVHEAFDGREALEIAYRTNPDLVISDILMPKLDGFSLCRALRRDVALRDVPVILLSWKEDLLQRVRELGAGAAGYVRKESDTRAILARVREALRTRSRIEQRLRDNGEARGRLDGISVRTLLEIAAAAKPSARVSVRDASFTYEVEIREGAPVRVTRTSGDGNFVRGPRILAAMLGVTAGRFTVMGSTSTIDVELEGSLAAQLAHPVSRARAAVALLSGPEMTRVHHVVLDAPALEDYLRATPSRAKVLVERLAAGAAPSALVLEGVCEASLLEDLVCDLASRGLIVDVLSEGDVDMLGPASGRFAKQADARMPLTRTAAPGACAEDASPKCEGSPSVPRATVGADDIIARELSQRSPSPAQLALPLPKSEVKKPKLVIDEDDGTPPHDQILALAEPTVVEHTHYGKDESIPIFEASQSLVLSPRPKPAETPLSSVAATDVAGLPKPTRVWPIGLFIVATAAVVWGALSYGQGAVEKAPETVPPPAETTLAPSAPADKEAAYAEMPKELGEASGRGAIEVSATADAIVIIDGTERGRGTATTGLSVGPHEVRVSGSAGETMRMVDVRAGQLARVKF